MAQSRAQRKARHASYQQGEMATLHYIIAEQRQQIADLKRLVRMLRLKLEAARA